MARIRYINKELRNKMQVIMVPISDDTGFAMGFSVRAGIALEPENLLGITTLLERVMQESYSNDYIFENTRFGFRIVCAGTPEKLKDKFDGLVKIYHKYTFLEREVNAAKNVIIRDHHDRISSDPIEAMYAYIQKTLFLDIPEDDALVGKQHVDHISKQNVQEFMKAYFRPDNTLFMIMGKFPEREIYDVIKENFKGRPSKSPLEPELDINRQTRIFRKAFENQTSPKIHVIVRENFRESLIFITFFIGFDYMQPQIHNVFGALMAILRSIGNAGRIHARLRTQEGFIYSHGASTMPRFELLQVFFQTHPKFVKRAIQAALEEIYRLATELISNIELRVIKQDVFKMSPIGFIGLSALREHAKRFETYQEQENLSPIVKYQQTNAYQDEVRARIDAEVTPEAIRDMAAKIFVPEHLNVFIMGKPLETEIKL